MSDSDSESECPVCTSPFTKVKRSPIVCPSCDASCCKECIQTYLLGIADDAHCMNCKQGYTYEWLCDNLSKAFINGKWKTSREEILYTREQAMLPSTQAEVIAEKNKRKRKHQIEKLMKERKVLLGKAKILSAKIKELQWTKDEQVEKKEFNMKCPRDGCKGYLSSVGKCGLCEWWICMKCHIPKEKENQKNLSTDVKKQIYRA